MEKLIFNFYLIISTVFYSITSYALIKPIPNRNFISFEVWEGSAIQDDGSSWTIKFSIKESKYYIDYPSLKCGGELTPLLITPLKFEFIEHIEYGKTICLDKGYILITKTAENTALFSYSHPDAVAEGRLIRR